MRRTWFARLVVAGLGSCAAIAGAQQPFHVTVCSTMAVNRLHEGEGTVTWALDGKGITMGAEPGSPFDSMTSHCALVGRTVAGRPAGTGFCKWMDPDGDVVIWEVTVNGGDDALRAVHGTGKWKGIQAQGAAVVITKAKPIAPDLRQTCRRFKGTMAVPKAT